MVRAGLDTEDRARRLRVICRAGPADLAHVGPGARESLDRTAHGRCDRRIAVVPHVIGGHTDAKVLRPPVDAGEEIRDGAIRRNRIARVVSRDRGHRDSDISHGARERPWMIERPGERNGAAQACAAECWLEPDAAAERRRNADAASGVAAESGVCLAHDDRHRGPARGATRDLCRVPRIAHVAEVRVDGADAVRELVQSELAEEHRARFAQLPHDGRVLIWHPVGEDPGARGRADPFCCEQVLHRDGYPVQWAFVSTRLDLALSLASLLARELGRDGDERVDTRLERLDPCER